MVHLLAINPIGRMHVDIVSMKTTSIVHSDIIVPINKKERETTPSLVPETIKS
jgi:hypothetical protein